MPPKGHLSQSSAKSKFFESLLLSEDNEAHAQLYNLMKEEAIEGRRRLSLDPLNLNVHRREDPNTRPPYAWDDISETARHREVLRIYQDASAETRILYEKGRYEEGGNIENWVIKWMLWHVFRYRDNRNRDTRRRRRNAQAGRESPTMSEGRSEPTISSSTPVVETRSTTAYWDPVRDT